MGFELTVDRIEKVKDGYIVAGERDQQDVKIKVKKLYGAKEGDIVECSGGKLTVLREKTNKRREQFLKLQKELSD